MSNSVFAEATELKQYSVWCIKPTASCAFCGNCHFHFWMKLYKMAKPSMLCLQVQELHKAAEESAEQAKSIRAGHDSE